MWSTEECSAASRGMDEGALLAGCECTVFRSNNGLRRMFFLCWPVLSMVLETAVAFVRQSIPAVRTRLALPSWGALRGLPPAFVWLFEMICWWRDEVNLRFKDCLIFTTKDTTNCISAVSCAANSVHWSECPGLFNTLFGESWCASWVREPYWIFPSEKP